MTRRDPDIIQELEGISPAVASLHHTLPYRVPEGYFEHLPETILERVRSSEAQDEITGLSPLLASLKGKPTYTVPDGYFEASLAGMSHRSQPVTTAQDTSSNVKVVSLTSWRSWPRMAAAASITLLLMVATWYFTGNSGISNDTPIPSELATAGPNPGDTDSIAISAEALAGFLEESVSLPGEELITDLNVWGSQDLAILDVTDTRISQWLEELPDTDLEAYVDQHPEARADTDMN